MKIEIVSQFTIDAIDPIGVCGNGNTTTRNSNRSIRARGSQICDDLTGRERARSLSIKAIMDKESGANNSILARFDCDLSLDINRDFFKRNNLRFNDETYFQKSTHYNGYLKKLVERQDKKSKAHL